MHETTNRYALTNLYYFSSLDFHMYYNDIVSQILTTHTDFHCEHDNHLADQIYH